MPWRSNMFLASSSSSKSAEQAEQEGPTTHSAASSQPEEPAVSLAAVATSSSEASPVMTSMRSASAPRSSLPPQQHQEQTLSSASETTTRCVRKSPMPSGLSALIQAATAQLTLLVEEQASEEVTTSKAVVSGNGHHPPDTLSGVTTDDGASSDGGGGGGAAAGGGANRTPTIVPEPDPSKQSFPELLMTLAVDPNNEDTIAFLPDGKFFALRSKQFSEEIMIHYFTVTTFEEFLDLTYDWGFTRILQDPSDLGIEVFRHPQFIKGEWAKCALMKFGETPTDARLSALPDRARIEYTMSDESNSSGTGQAVPGGPHSKRRLSPGFIKRRESEGSIGAGVPKKRHSLEGQQQKRFSLDTSGNCVQGPALAAGNVGRSASVGRAESEAGDIASYTNHSRSDDIRSVALALTTEKLNLRNDNTDNGVGGHDRTGSDVSSCSRRLVDQAVKSATYTIVTDAIETLLNDESHTKETYLKHEEELSKSCIPGVVPISKQLFEPRKDGSTNMNREPPKEVITTASEEAQSPPSPPTAAADPTSTSATTTKPSASGTKTTTTTTTTTNITRSVTRRRRSMPEIRELHNASNGSNSNNMTPIDFLKIPPGLTSQAITSPPPPAPAIVSTTTSTTLET